MFRRIRLLSTVLVQLRQSRLRPPRLSIDQSDPWGTKSRFSLENVSLSVSSDQHWLILGNNGSGKTTLGKALCGLTRPLTGDFHSSIPLDRISYMSFADQTQLLRRLQREEDLMNDMGRAHPERQQSSIPSAGT